MAVSGVTPLSSLPRVLCLPKKGSTRATNVLGSVAGEGGARVVRLSALANGDPTLDRREIRVVLRLDKQTQHARELERAQVGLAGRRERGGSSTCRCPCN